MPEWLFALYARALSRLEAEEALSEVGLLQVGGGLASKESAERFMGELRTQAAGRAAQQPVGVIRPRSMEEMAALFGSIKGAVTADG